MAERLNFLEDRIFIENPNPILKLNDGLPNCLGLELWHANPVFSMDNPTDILFTNCLIHTFFVLSQILLEQFNAIFLLHFLKIILIK